MSSAPSRLSGLSWVIVIASVGLAVVAVLCAPMTGWGPGTLALILQTGPVALTAWSGNRRAAIYTVCIATLTCLFEGGFGWGHHRNHDWPFAMFSVGLIVALSGSILGFSDPYGRGVFLKDESLPDPDSSEATPPPSTHSDTDAVASGLAAEDFSLLLLALQEVVRRIVADLDAQTLPTTIVETGRELLAAEDARIAFWNAGAEELTLHGPSSVETVPVDRMSAVVRWVLTRRHPALRGDPLTSPELAALFALDSRPALRDRAWDAVLPLMSGGELLGVLLFRGVTNSSRQQRLLAILANVAALAWRNATLFGRIEQMSRRDGLTGLLSHAAFFEAAQTAFRNAPPGPAAVLIADADHFKQINDRFGHPTGDAALRMIAHVWRSLLPADAIAGRYGGEEFVALLPGCDRARAEEIAETIRAQIELSPVSGTDVFGATGEVRVTVSVGLAISTVKTDPVDAIVARADAALYRAKQAGRNLVRADGA